MHRMGVLRTNVRRLDLEEQELPGLWGQNFGADTSYVVVVDELMVVLKLLRRK